MLSFSSRATTTSSVLLTLDSKIENIAAQTAAKRASQEEHDKTLQAVLKEVTDRKDKSGYRKGTIDRDSMLMDVDDVLEQAKGKNRKFVLNLPIFWLTF
jgi:COP9 signalosome complex subunit 7